MACLRYLSCVNQFVGEVLLLKRYNVTFCWGGLSRVMHVKYACKGGVNINIQAELKEFGLIAIGESLEVVPCSNVSCL